MTNGLINSLSYATNTTTDNKKVGSNSYVDNSTAFDDVLQTANKNFSQSHASSANKILDHKFEKPVTTATQAGNKIDTPQKNNENTNKKDSPKSIKNDNNDNQNDNKHVSSKRDDNDHHQINNDKHDDRRSKTQDNINNSSEQDNTSNKDENDTTSNNTDKNTTNEVQNVLTEIVTPDVICAAAVTGLAVNQDASQAQQPTDNNQANNNTQEVTAAQQTAQVNDNLDVNLTSDVNLANATNDNDLKSARVKVQPQTQQVLLNLKPDDQASQIQDALKDQAQKTADPSKDVQSPFIQANIDAINNVETNSDKSVKPSIKEILEKANLNQDLLDKTNARVVSVETTNSSSSNLLNQDNAQGQSARLAFENSNSITNGNLANVTGATTQTNFAQTLDNAQQPKEISHTEILSQINSKLNEVQDEGTTKVTIVLKPENLGKINLELVNGKDGFTASLTAENSHVKELLDKNLEGLRNTLGSQGFNVNNVTVKVAETQKQSSDMFAFDQQQQGQNNQQSSNNSHQSGQERHGYEDEYTLANDSTIVEEPSVTVSHAGQVDYKI